MNKNKIAIIGCGWLGLPLVKKLSALGHSITTTTTTLDKNIELNNFFSSIIFDVTKNRPNKELTNSNVLIYTIPPLGKNEVESFFQNIDQDKKIIFISSTSIYGKNQGVVDEDSSFDPKSKNALVLRKAEEFLKIQFKNLSIVRPGGLYADKRHPIYFLAGKTGITSGDEYLHLVHRDDCINAVTKMIELNLIGEDFNLISDLRILKKDYYTNLAKKLHFTPPIFEHFPVLNPTNISNEKSKKLLQLNYQDPSLF